MTPLETQILERAAVPLLQWTARKLKAGLLGRTDRELVSQAVQELLAARPNLARVEDLLAEVDGQPEGLSFVRRQLEQAREADRLAAESAKRGRKSGKTRPARKVK